MALRLSRLRREATIVWEPVDTRFFLKRRPVAIASIGDSGEAELIRELLEALGACDFTYGPQSAVGSGRFSQFPTPTTRPGDVCPWARGPLAWLLGLASGCPPLVMIVQAARFGDPQSGIGPRHPADQLSDLWSHRWAHGPSPRAQPSAQTNKED